MRTGLEWYSSKCSFVSFLFVSLVFKQGTNQCMTTSACVVLLVGLVVLVGVGSVFHPARSQESFSCGSPHVSRKEWLCSECCLLCVSSFSLSSPHVVRLKEWLCSECCSLSILSFSLSSPHVVRLKEWFCSECCSLSILSFSLSSRHIVRLKEWLCSECCSLCVLLFICCGPHVSRRKEWLYTSVCDWWSVGAILSVWVVRMSADRRSGCTHQCVTGGVWERYFQSELSACHQMEEVVVFWGLTVFIVHVLFQRGTRQCVTGGVWEWYCSRC